MSTDPRDEMSPPLRDAFAALRSEMEPPAGAGMAAARAAMHEAREAVGRPRRTLLPRVWELRHSLSPRSLALSGGAFAAALASVLVVGWNAPAGSPLHAVRVAREQIALAVPGADRVGLELSDAEARLADAARGGDPSASLDEAARLLADAHTHLPADHASALWTRWGDDEKRLDDLQHAHEDGGGSTSGGSTPGGAPSSGSGGGPGPSGGSGGGGGGSSTGTSGDGDGGSTGSGGTSQSATTSTSTSAPSRDGGGSSSSTSTSSSSSGGDDGGSSSSSSTSDGGGDSGGGGSATSSGGSGH